MAIKGDAWTSLVGEGILLNGVDPTALHRARIRARNTARQRREGRHDRHVREAEAVQEAAAALLAPCTGSGPLDITIQAAAAALQVPAWLEAELQLNTAALEDAPAPPRRRGGYVKPAPLSDRVALLMRDHPDWNAAQLATAAGCSVALVRKVGRSTW